jgi:hypothetical protein
MVCTHLKDLYQLCLEHELRLGGSDLIRIVCRQCGEQEVCPSMLMDEYDATHADQPVHEYDGDVDSEQSATRHTKPSA